MKLYRALEHMSYATAAIQGLRDDANARAAKLGAKDPLQARLLRLAADSDVLRSRIVATKEGGMITGEERIRELLGKLYGDVTGYEGRPTDYQAARADSLNHELEDVVGDFRKLTDKELPTANAALKKKKGGGARRILPEEEDEDEDYSEPVDAEPIESEPVESEPIE